MFLCRAAWRRCGPAARQCLTRRVNPSGDVAPRRLMSSVPGGSDENLIYVIVCGGAVVGAVAYTYNMMCSDRARYAHRINQIQKWTKSEWQPKPWPPKGGEKAEELLEASAEVIGEEAGLAGVAAEVEMGEAGSVEAAVETVAEAIAEDVVEVATVVEEVAEEVVVAVAQEVREMAEEVETAAEASEAPKLLVEEVAGVEEPAAAPLEKPPAQSNVAQENIELSTASVLEESLMVCVGEVIPGTEPAVPLEAEAQKPEELLVALDADKAPLTLATKEASVATIAEDAAVTMATEVSVVSVVEEAPVTLETTEDAMTVLTAEEASVTPITYKVSVTPEAVEKEAIPLVAEIIPIVLAEKLPVHLPAVHWQAVAEVPTPAETAVLPADVEDPTPEPNPEYTMVVKGGLKADKNPKVLGVSTISGSIMPVHDNDESMQMLTEQAPPA